MITYLTSPSQAEKIKESKEISLIKQFVSNSLSSLPVSIPSGALKELEQPKQFSDTNVHKKYISFENDPNAFDRHLEDLANQQLAEKNKKDCEDIFDVEDEYQNPCVEIKDDLNKSVRSYSNTKKTKILRELYDLSKTEYAKNKSGQYFDPITINQIMALVKCSKTTALKYLKELADLQIVTITKSKAKLLSNGLIRSSKTTYIINLEPLKKHMENENLIPRVSARIYECLDSNIYKKEIININDSFNLNGKRITKEEIHAEEFIEKNISDLVSVAKNYQEDVKLSFNQTKTIIKTFLKVVGNVKKNSEELARMILGWIKNRYKQIISKPKEIIEKQTSLWQETEDFIEYNGHLLCNNYVLNVANEVKTNVNYAKIANNSQLNGWIPSRDLIYNKSREMKNFIKRKISKSTYFKRLGTLMINAKLKNIGKEEYLI